MKINLRLFISILNLIFVLASSGSLVASFAQGSTAATRITTASGVRVRSAPQTTADEIVRLPIGTVFTELGRSDKKDTINGVETYWYKLKTDDGKEGWIFGGFTALVDAKGPETSYLNIARVRLKLENASYSDLFDLTEFLGRVSSEIKNPNRKAEIDLDHLLAMQKMLLAIPTGKSDQPVYDKWLKTHKNEVDFSEPCGCWLVRYDLLWDLYKKNAKLPIAEEIAWAAANGTLGGECEGLLDCMIGAYNITFGRYLDLYPHGTHVNDALGNLQEDLEWGIKNMNEAEGIKPGDRADLQKELTKVQARVRKTGSSKEQRILDQIDQIAKHYK